MHVQHLLHQRQSLWYFLRRMQVSSEISDRREPSISQSIRIDEIEIRLIRLPLNEPFETSFGSIDSRLIFLVSIAGDGLRGWGEVVAAEKPLYSYETVGTAFHVIRDFLAPVMLTGPIGSLAELATRFSRFRGHNMAKAGLELAFMDVAAQFNGQPLSVLLGGQRKRIPVGVSLGIQSNVDQLIKRMDSYLALGYQRIKLKIKPGWDIDVVAQVRNRYPGILLSVDANSAYTLEDRKHLKRLDQFDLLMIEQPLENDDLVDHAQLQNELTTPICLDESITGWRQAKKALELQSCRMINIKVGRVGGYSQAIAVHNLCVSEGVPVWCGGMLESGIGRSHNVALASLPGFTLPGDISASSRYFTRDLIVPEVTVARDGMIDVPNGIGLGFAVDLDFINSQTETLEVIKRTG
ncbi:MAG TPA: o-succinylbenzoate synthase [Pyrinomonadaceae bacterium]|nr:o-succinylbenzoate synthase [Pyrinomonadaceae bacterium]